MALSIRTRQSSSRRARQNLALILPLLALLIFRLATRPHNTLSWTDALLDVTGMALLVVGLVIRVLARQWKAERAHDGLVTDGLYGYVRHPLYLGSGLVGLGLALVVGDPLIVLLFAVLFSVNHGLVLRAEERELEAAFGQRYSAYRVTVPALVPRLRRQPMRVLPLHLREAIVRECDAICIWLALPLLIQLTDWSLYRQSVGEGLGPYGAILGFAIGALTAVWIRLKAEYHVMIRRERSTRLRA